MLSQRRRTVVASLVWALLLIGTPTVAAFGQEPVTKPAPSPPRTGDRLPLPRNVRAVQHPDGRIVVTWSPVSGATAYAITRSVPPDPAAPITPNVTDTMFVERQVTAGKTYYYVIAGVNDAATGMKAGASVKATRSFDASGSHLAPTNVVARYDAATNRVILTWQGPSPAAFLIERDGVLQAGRVDRPPYVYATAASGTRMQFRVRTQDPFGVQSPWVAANEVSIPGAGATPSDTSAGTPTSPGGPTSTTGPAGTIAVTIGSAITMRVGASASGTSALGGASATRWVSLDEGIATVDGSGTVAARTSGRARVLAIAGAGDGSVRVTLVHVTVIP